MRKQVLILSALFISMTVFGQKNELKTAEKAIKANDFAAAQAVLDQAEALIANADQKTKAKFYYLKGKALYQNGSANADILKVGEAFNQLIDYENETKKPKYSSEFGGLLNKLITSVAEKASSDYSKAEETKEPTDYLSAAKKYNQVFALSPRDTAFLDNAAQVYFKAKDYETSKKLYEKLLELNYTGITTVYVATNKDDGSEVYFNDKKAMDLQVKLGIVENPKEEAKDSRREFIFKTLAQNYAALDDNAKALEVIAQGRSEFPESYSLLIDEANIYYKLGDNAKFKEKLEEAITINPTDPTLYYNVGVMNMDEAKVNRDKYQEKIDEKIKSNSYNDGEKNVDQEKMNKMHQEKLVEAIKFFEKAIELKPDYGEAYNNIGAAIIDKTIVIQADMDKYASSDWDKYDALVIKRNLVYKESLPFYEKAYELDEKNINVIRTLMGLYENLEMTEKLDEIRPIYEELKG